MLHPGGGHSGLQGLLYPILLRGAEDVYEGPIREGPQGVGGGVGPSQGVEPQPAPVDDRLPQGPEHHGAAGPPEHLGHIGGVGEGQVLEHDEVRGKGIEIRPQGVQGQEFLLGADEVAVHGLQGGRGALEGVLGALHMEGGDPHRHVRGDEGFHGFPPADSLLNNIPSRAPFVNGFSLDMYSKVA